MKYKYDRKLRLGKKYSHDPKYQKQSELNNPYKKKVATKIPNTPKIYDIEPPPQPTNTDELIAPTKIVKKMHTEDLCPMQRLLSRPNFHPDRLLLWLVENSIPKKIENK